MREQVFPFVEAQLGKRTYLCDEFTIADVPFMALAMVLQVDGMELDDWPALKRYLERLRERPSYRAIDPATPLEEAKGSHKR